MGVGTERLSRMEELGKSQHAALLKQYFSEVAGTSGMAQSYMDKQVSTEMMRDAQMCHFSRAGCGSWSACTHVSSLLCSVLIYIDGGSGNFPLKPFFLFPFPAEAPPSYEQSCSSANSSISNGN